MGQRAGSCFDLGVTMAMAETHQGRVDGPDSRYIADVNRNLGVAEIHAENILTRDKILINKGRLDSLVAGDHGTGSIRDLRTEFSEQINVFDSINSNSTLCGKCYDLGVAMGFGECQASFWDTPPDSDIQASGDLAMNALEGAKPFAESLKNAFPGVSPEGIDWIRLGFFDPEGTGNGFQVLYQRCVQGRELLERSIFGAPE
jgi:hypothetical protein